MPDSAREEAAPQMADITIYTRDFCGYCVRAKRLLDTKGATYQEINIDLEPGRAAEMIERSQGGRTVPQIFINDVHVGGCDDLVDLHRAGKLDEMLQQEARRPEPVETHDVVIIGSGPAGLTSALYTARANLKPVVVEGLAAGGQLMNTTEVENYPGFPEGITGPELMEKFKQQAERFGTVFVPGDAIKVDFSARPFGIWTDEKELRANAVIVASGASPLTLGIPGEEEYAGRGVSYCATCDGFFFRDQEIVVVGGGDTAMEEALFLARYGKRVTVIHRRDELRASKIMADRALEHDKIEFLWNSVVEEVVGDGTKVQSLKVKNVQSGEVTDRECGGFFVAIGHTPNTEIFKNVLPMEDTGYLKLSNGSTSNIEGIFIAGDVHDHTYRQAVTAAGYGCRAAIDCERWLESQGR